MNTKKIILYADDDANDIFFVKRALSAANLDCQLRYVDDGDEAVKWISGQGVYADRSLYPMPDIFVTDLNMPRMHGLEVIKLLRSRPEYDNLPIIVSSTIGQPSSMLCAQTLGANAYVIKDSRCVQLVQVLQQFLGKSGSAPVA